MQSRMRTVLLCTPINPRHIDKSLSAGADVVVFDWEDSVEVSRKAAARQTVTDRFAMGQAAGSFVRVNATGSAYYEEDVSALEGLAGLGGVVLPKVETSADLASLDAALTRLEASRGLAPASVRVLPLIETALGVENISDILATRSSRVDRLSFGAGDYSLDIGARITADESALGYIRARLVNASRAAGKLAPVDSVWLDVSDEQGLAQSAVRARNLGFGGKLCIHPRQVAVAAHAFQPSDEEIAVARRHVAEFEAAVAQGLAAIHVAGVLVDYPVAERARRTLREADVSPA
ncbi:MAG: CoA ester lyase [Proteobacteria bacterium]|nr:CoA ester lyase [Pseudomonadota bacterium]